MLDDVLRVIGEVRMMGGRPLNDMLAPSELQEIASALLDSGLIGRPAPRATYPPHLAWMETLPPELHDCFNG